MHKTPQHFQQTNRPLLEYLELAARITARVEEWGFCSTSMHKLQKKVHPNAEKSTPKQQEKI